MVSQNDLNIASACAIFWICAFLVDARSAGDGQIVAEVRSASGGVPSDLSATSTKKIYLLSFLPKEGGEHTINVTFNDEQVPRE